MSLEFTIWGAVQTDERLGWLWNPGRLVDTVVGQATVGNYRERVTSLDVGNFMEGPGEGPNWFPRYHCVVRNDVFPKPVHYKMTFVSLP
jgi:hypothetical protein